VRAIRRQIGDRDDVLVFFEVPDVLRVLQEGERFDIIAGEVYGDGRLWWIIAAASGIGWFLQVPPGTRINVPVSMDQIARLI
jgi:hypothetical protein